METAGKLVEDEELRQQMKESGLGTPATRASIIERLIKVGYLERREERYSSLPQKGKASSGPCWGMTPLASPELTARWEKRLARMERGDERRAVTFMDDIGYFTTADWWSGSGAYGRCRKLTVPSARAVKPLGAVSLSAVRRSSTDQKVLRLFEAWKGGCDFAIWKNDRRQARERGSGPPAPQPGQDRAS